jgi:hypothetical protein
MTLKLGYRITNSELLRHLVANDPDYLPHLTKVLKPYNMTPEAFYGHIEKWDFHKLGLDRPAVDLLREEATRPTSKLLARVEGRSLELSTLAFHVLSTADRTLTQQEMLEWYQHGVGAFTVAKLPTDGLVWFQDE